MAFMASEQFVNVELQYVELGDTDMIVIHTDKQRDVFKGKIKTAKARFIRPKYGNFNIYIDGCVTENQDTGETIMDTMKLKNNKIRTLLWDLVDGDGQPVELNEEFFSDVMPDFAIGLVQAYDEALNIERMNFLREMGIFDALNKKGGKDAEPEDKKEEKKEEPSE